MTYQVPARVGYVVLPPEGTQGVRVYLMELPDGTPQQLSGVGALIWVLAWEGEHDVPGALAELVGRPRSDVAADTEAFLADLVARGMLEVRP